MTLPELGMDGLCTQAGQQRSTVVQVARGRTILPTLLGKYSSSEGQPVA